MSNRPPKVRIISQGVNTAQVFLGDLDISRHVTAVTWHMQAGGKASAHLDLYNVEIDAEGQLYAPVKLDPAAVAELAKLANTDGFEDLSAERTDFLGRPVPEPLIVKHLTVEGFEDLVAKHLSE